MAATSLFHSPHEFLVLGETDPRRAQLLALTERDGTDGGWRGLRVFPLQHKPHRRRRHLHQWLFSLLTFATAVMVAARIVVFGSALRFDVDARCVRLDESLFALSDLLYAPVLAGFVLSAAIIGHLGVQLVGGMRPFAVLAWRHTVFAYSANRRVLVCTCAGLVTNIATGRGLELAGLVITALSVGVADLLLLFSSSPFTMRVFAAAATLSFAGAYARRRAMHGDCSRLAADTADRTSLEASMIDGAANQGILLFYLAVSVLNFRRLVQPRRPIAQSPRFPYFQEGRAEGNKASQCKEAEKRETTAKPTGGGDAASAGGTAGAGAGAAPAGAGAVPAAVAPPPVSSPSPSPSQSQSQSQSQWRTPAPTSFDVQVAFYSSFELRILRLGGELHAMWRDDPTSRGSWEARAPPSTRLDTAMAVVFVIVTVSYLSNMLLLVADAMFGSDPALRCFAEHPPALATAYAVTLNGSLVGFTVAAAIGIVQWSRVIRDPWRALARYAWFMILRNHLSFTVISVGVFAMSIVDDNPHYRVPALGSIVLTPVLDAVLINAASTHSRLITHRALAILILHSIVSYLSEAIVSANRCSARDAARPTLARFVASAIAAAFNAAWIVALLTLFTRKLGDVTRPNISFKLREGVGYDTAALFADRDGAGGSGANGNTGAGGANRAVGVRHFELQARAQDIKLRARGNLVELNVL